MEDELKEERLEERAPQLEGAQKRWCVEDMFGKEEEKVSGAMEGTYIVLDGRRVIAITFLRKDSRANEKMGLTVQFAVGTRGRRTAKGKRCDSQTNQKLGLTDNKNIRRVPIVEPTKHTELEVLLVWDEDSFRASYPPVEACPTGNATGLQRGSWCCEYGENHFGDEYESDEGCSRPTTISANREFVVILSWNFNLKISTFK
ncbi:hypothetical protein NA56DRAFT_655191 [Hyaloscypha hepaticicola]|uniref:Uncharacterized protein n=1 Tax=Hyaloscypha hepaticicola TaxID=2082293 RepID=A0A2J6QHL4_9HELO|nr:hypothetical protein NA56DRAFT_655191 [Hyaloscypha hepaticicola]